MDKDFVEWLINNPELAENYHPLLVGRLKDRIQNHSPFRVANIIQNLPEHFPKWETEINNHRGKYREKKIKEQITLLKGLLNEYQFKTEIESQAVESVRPFLTEQLKYWENELKALPPQQENLDFEFQNNFDNVNETEVYDHFKTGLVKNNMLSEDELQNFLIAAFQNQTAPNKKISLKNVESKDKVMKVFYQYYKDKAGKPHGKQKQYAGLLGGYFQSFKTSTVSSNFSKSVY